MGYPQRRHCASRPGSRHSDPDQRHPGAASCGCERRPRLIVESMIALLCLFFLALGAGVLSGVVGTGSSLIMLPVRHAVRATDRGTCDGDCVLFGNIGRVIAWWHEIRWRPVLAYSLAGVPAAVLGAHTLLTISPATVDVFLAAFFLAMIPLRRLIRRSNLHLNLWHMSLAGAIVGFLTGFVLSTGPLSVPVFTGYGMSGGAFRIGSAARYPALRRQAGYVRSVGRTCTARHRTWTCHRHRIACRFHDCETSRSAAPDAHVRASH